MTIPTSRTRCCRAAGHREGAHDHHEHEQVVDAEGVLHQVAGHELPAVLQPEVDGDEDREEPGHRDVEDHPPQGLLRRERVRATVDEDQVDRDDADQDEDRGCPEPAGTSTRSLLLAVRVGTGADRRLTILARCGRPPSELACAVATLSRAHRAGTNRPAVSSPCGPRPLTLPRHPPQLLLQVGHLVAQPGRHLELQLAAAACICVGELLDEPAQLVGRQAARAAAPVPGGVGGRCPDPCRSAPPCPGLERPEPIGGQHLLGVGVLARRAGR